MPKTPSPALSDIALRETLDLLSRVVASMSVRIDQQGEKIETLTAALEDTRTAARTAAKQTDHRAYAKMMGEEFGEALDQVLDAFADTLLALRTEHETTTKRLKDLEQAEEAALERLRKDLSEAARWRRQVPWVWAGAVAAGLVLALSLNTLF